MHSVKYCGFILCETWLQWNKQAYTLCKYLYWIGIDFIFSIFRNL